MGDCRLRLLVQRTLLATSNDDDEDNILNASQYSSSLILNQVVPALQATFSADTSIRELLDTIQTLLSTNSTSLLTPDNSMICIWDCTTHPPKDVTNMFVNEFTETLGPRSKTLYDAGWFPSGTLQVLRRGETPKLARALDYDDAQYNSVSPTPLSVTETTSTTSTSGSAVQWQGTKNTVLPSHILQSVKERWQDDDEKEDNRDHSGVSDSNSSESITARKLRLERERCRKLQDRIRQLDTKQGAVSQQVRRMLIKSRATGRSSLAIPDRVYLHCVVVQDGEPSASQSSQQGDAIREDFCFFSRQDTAGKIVETLVKTLSPVGALMERENFRAEFLIRRPVKHNMQRPPQGEAEPGDDDDDDDMVYRRLPTTMRLYEAIETHLIEKFDSIVVRCYEHPTEHPTTSILDDEEYGCENAVTLERTTSEAEHVDAQQSNTISDVSVEVPKVAAEGAFDSSIITDEAMAQAIQALDDKDSKGKKRSSTAASVKVRSMLIKSRAKGDAKRVPKMEDRFYMELLLLDAQQVNSDVGSDHRCEATNVLQVFLAKKDTLGRIFRDCLPVAVGNIISNVALYMPVTGDSDTTTSHFRRVESLDLTLSEAERTGLIKPFDRVIVVAMKK